MCTGSRKAKWEACEARLTAQLAEAIKRIAILKDQSEARENRLPSVSEENDENIELVSSFVLPTVSHTHTDVSKEVISKNKILKGSHIGTLEKYKTCSYYRSTSC